MKSGSYYLGWPRDHVVCDKCTYERHMPDTNYDYCLPDGGRLYVIRGRAWCFSCKQVVQAEYLLSLAEIESELRVINSWPREPTRPSAIEATAHIRKQMELRKAFALRRRSPPRCLECGSSNITTQESGGEGNRGLVHPECGGRLRPVYPESRVWLPMADKEYEPVLLDGEGRPVAEGYEGRVPGVVYE
jgi:hypothetical protein